MKKSSKMQYDVLEKDGAFLWLRSVQNGGLWLRPQPTLLGLNQLTVTVPTLFCERTVPEEFVTTPLTV